MRSVGKLLGLWLAGAALGACQDDDSLLGLEASAQIDDSGLDFGQVPVGEWRSQPIQVRNVGRMPFNAVEALALQGNPAFAVELDPGLVPQDSERTVVVRFHPLSEGPSEERLFVGTDARKGRSAEVMVRGEGVPLQLLPSPAALDFQTLELDSERTLEVTVQNPVDLPLAVSLEGPQRAQFDVDRTPLPAFSSQTLRVRYRPQLLGSAQAALTFRPCSTCTPSEVPLSGQAVASAFVFSPAPLAFDDIPVHEATTSRTVATNITWRSVDVTAYRTSDISFTPLSFAPRTVGPGESRTIEVEFAARSFGPKQGTLSIEYQSDRNRSSEVVLDASGGHPQLALTPVTIDFGELPVGGKVERTVRLTNAGTRGDLVFYGARAQGDTAQFGIGAPRHRGANVPWSAGTWPDLTAPDLPIAPGTENLDLRVYFQPEAAGAFSATLIVRTSDRFHPERTVVLTGRARNSGPCVWRILPASVLDFGNVPPNTGAVLGFRFENAGQAECAVKDIHVSDDAGGTFFMPGGPLVGGVLIVDDAFSTQVAFRAKTSGTYLGKLELTVNNPAQPKVELPLRAVAEPSCLAAAPNFLDFGPIRSDCAPGTRRTWVSNQCPSPVQVESAWIGEGTSWQFDFTTPPPVPVLLAPGQGFELEVAYARNILGQHESPLWVKAQNETSPLLIPLLAETNHEGRQIERFIQGTDNQLDVLFVLSNSSTMGPFQSRLRAAIPSWVSQVRANGVDMRVAVTTTGLVPRGQTCPGGVNGGEAGRLFPVDLTRPRVVLSTSADAATRIQQNLDVGLCHNLVQGLEAMRQALSAPLLTQADDPRTPEPQDGNGGFLRETARLAVILVADEDDHSGFDPESYVQLLRALKGSGMSHRTTAYALIPVGGGCSTAGPPGPRFAALAQGTGGTVEDICTGNYSALLTQLSTRATGLQADFHLSEIPGTDPLRVTVDGQPAPASDWHFNPTQNAVVFQPGHLPKPGQLVEVRYRNACAP